MTTDPCQLHGHGIPDRLGNCTDCGKQIKPDARRKEIQMDEDYVPAANRYAEARAPLAEAIRLGQEEIEFAEGFLAAARTLFLQVFEAFEAGVKWERSRVTRASEDR